MQLRLILLFWTFLNGLRPTSDYLLMLAFSFELGSPLIYGQYEVADYMYFTSTIITFLHILWVLFFINVYKVKFLFNNVIYVFLLLWLCILVVCLYMATLTEVFPCFFLSYKANVRVKPAKMGQGPHSSKFFFCSMYFCVVLYILCLCCSLYCLCVYVYCTTATGWLPNCS
jgi:hypothetical protein